MPLPAEAAGADDVADADEAFDWFELVWLFQPPLEISALSLLVVLPTSLTCGAGFRGIQGLGFTRRASPAGYSEQISKKSETIHGEATLVSTPDGTHLCIGDGNMCPLGNGNPFRDPLARSLILNSLPRRNKISLCSFTWSE